MLVRGGRLPPPTTSTPVRHGDVFALICYVSSALIWIVRSGADEAPVMMFMYERRTGRKTKAPPL